MVMESDPWRELYRSDDLREASVVATSIAAMEFEVRVRDLELGTVVEATSPGPSRAAARGGPFVIETRPRDWPDLAAVLDEIIEEQREFDAMLRSWHERTGRLHRGTLVLVIVGIVIVLGVLVLAERESP